MKLHSDSRTISHRVNAYAPGEIRIGQTIYRRSLIVNADIVLPDWRPQTFDAIDASDMEPILALEPEVVILGAGITARPPTSRFIPLFHRARIGIELMTTDAACRTYNILLAEGRNVTAALILS